MIVGLPLSLILFFGSGAHSFNYLEYWGPKSVLESGDTSYYKVKDFEFATSEGNRVTLEDFEDKILIAFVLSPTCPDTCAIQSDQLRLQVLEELNESSKYEDVAVLIQIKDYYGEPVQSFDKIRSFLGEQTNVTYVISDKDNPLYDFKPTEDALNLMRDKHPGIPGRKGFHQFGLLIDKERHVRGVYDLNHGYNVRTLMEELRILKREYNVEKS